MWTPLDIPPSPKQPFTDYSRWRLRDTYDGRHVWDFLKSDEELEAHPPSDADKYWLGLPLVGFHSSSWALRFLKIFCTESPITPHSEVSTGRSHERVLIPQKTPKK
jgi:hypothetical protein